MSVPNPLLTIEQDNRTIFHIIGWWELRRFLYNIIVLFFGLFSLTIMHLVVDLEPGEDFQEPIAIFGFAFLCNFGYTLGWLTEIFRKKSKTYGPKMFKIGLYFTLFWVLLPAVLHTLFWIALEFT